MFCPENLAVYVSAAALVIAQGKSSDEIGLLAVAFTQLGDTLSTIATGRQYNNDHQKAPFLPLSSESRYDFFGC